MNANIVRNTVLISMTRFLFVILIMAGACACRDNNDKPSEKDIVKKPEQLADRITRNLKEAIEFAIPNGGKINDSTRVVSFGSVRKIYDNNGYQPLWSSNGDWSAMGDSLYHFIFDARAYGLFPSDYHASMLKGIQTKLDTDTLASKDAALWSRADLMMTDALLRIGQDLRRGRLPYDSLSRNDTFPDDPDYYVNVLNDVLRSRQLSVTMRSLEPKLPGYTALRESVRPFVDTTAFRQYTYLYFPFTDSLQFYTDAHQRLAEEQIIDSMPPMTDSAAFSKVIAKYQASKKLKATGKMNENTTKSLNDTPWERFKRIAVSLDKYKLMPDTLPEIYVWVNIPAYSLKVMMGDSLALESKVIVGAAKTRTPELYSDISNFITYPQWTVPYSIIFKEMLPEIQKDTNYLAKQNLMVVDRNDSVLAPSTIDWSKLSKKKFPYLIRQREGDDNSLGVMKFNFRNKYAVYLHDTNARWMFSKSSRALSHGCVRVQDWEDLANFLVRDDTLKYHPDTLTTWIVNQEKHVVTGFKKLPLFIRYFTCVGINGNLKFYDDVYAEDKMLAEKYFAKSIY